MATIARREADKLPLEMPGFIGRRRELGKVKRLLGTSRLVTLTGVGGVGKTRLALQAATKLRRTFADGVWFVDLTSLRAPERLAVEVQDPDTLAYLVMGALGLREQPASGSPTDQMVDYLARRLALLVLDNCEHLLPGCAILVDALLRACPRLRILATSREALLTAGEVLYPVPPLPVPAPRAGPAAVGRSAAGALFVTRAQAVAPGFALTDDTAGAVGELCRRLDGLPLAIELAAAQIRVLTAAQILDRLAERFALLAQDGRSAPARQQTLRACMNWSFDLCAKPEQLLWARMAVFARGCELDAVEEVCVDELLPADDVLDLVAGLVDKSILIRDDQAGPAARYRMLETFRDFGLDQLVEAGEDAQLRRRHRDWCQQLVDRAGAEWISDRQGHWLGRLAREYPNLRAAVEYCLSVPGQAERALRLVVSLPVLYWWARGQYSESRSWLDRALAQTSEATPLRVRALLLNSYLAGHQGDFDTGMRLLDEGLDLTRQLDDPVDLAFALLIRGLYASFRNDLPASIDLLDQGLATLKAAPKPDLTLQLELLITSAISAGLAGDGDRVNAYHQEMMEITQARGETVYRSHALGVVGLTAWRQGNLAEATDQLQKCLRLKRDLDDRSSTAVALEILAWVAASRQQHQRAATLLGIVDALCVDLGAPLTSQRNLVDHHDACQRQARAALGEAIFDAAFGHGRALPLEAALDYALDENPQPAPAPSPRRRR